MTLSIYSRLLILSFFILIISSQITHAQDYKSSLGVRLGTYISTSFSTYISEGRSVEGLAGITREANQTDFILGGFYKFNMDVTSQVPTLKWYFGAGLYLNFNNEAGNVSFLPSSIIGMEYTLEHTPVNFFLDISPFYNINSNSDNSFNIHANLGARYVLSSYN